MLNALCHLQKSEGGFELLRTRPPLDRGKKAPSQALISSVESVITRLNTIIGGQGGLIRYDDGRLFRNHRQYENGILSFQIQCWKRPTPPKSRPEGQSLLIVVRISDKEEVQDVPSIPPLKSGIAPSCLGLGLTVMPYELWIPNALSVIGESVYMVWVFPQTRYTSYCNKEPTYYIVEFSSPSSGKLPRAAKCMPLAPLDQLDKLLGIEASFRGSYARMKEVFYENFEIEIVHNPSNNEMMLEYCGSYYGFPYRMYTPLVFQRSNLGFDLEQCLQGGKHPCDWGWAKPEQQKYHLEVAKVPVRRSVTPDPWRGWGFDS